MKKRILSVLLAVAMTLCFAGCNNADPATILQNAIDKTQALASMENEVAMTVKMDMGGMSMNVNADGNVKVKNDEKNPALSSTISMSLFGQDMTINTTYLDGYYYLDAAGVKAKAPMEYSELKKTGQNLADMVNEMNIDPKELGELEAKAEGDEMVYTFTADGDIAQGYVDAMMGLLGGTEDTEDTGDIKIDSVSGSLAVDKDGYLSKQNYTFAFTAEAEGQSVDYEMTMESTLKNPGEEVSITIDDPDSYQEVDAGTLLGASAL